MKKSLLKVGALALIIVFASAYSSNPDSSKVGYKAPNIEISNDGGTMSLQHKKGKYVLLTFWSSDDAESRIANIQYDRATENQDLVQYVAINYDRSENVYAEIVKNDGLKQENQFHDLGGKESKVFETYQLNQGMRSLLLDPQGKIMAENPSVQQIRELTM